ncbi:MAG TPA: hypothetical protein PKY81_11305 [bacterium]|nr:hypothetical protein [bacterium]
MSEKNFFHNVLVFFAVVCAGLLLTTCSKKQSSEDNQLPSPPELSELSAEIINYIQSAPDPLDYIIVFRNNKSFYSEVIPQPQQFNTAADRKKMIMRLGMLSVDIAYEKMIGGKTQLAEYDKIYQNYLNELNASSFFAPSFNKYLNMFIENDINDTDIKKFRVQWKEEKKELTNKILDLDEEFPVYYSIGILNEFTYITIIMTGQDKEDKLGKKIDEYIRKNDMALFRLALKLADNKKYSEYAVKLKPLAEISMRYYIKGLEYTEEEIQYIFKTVSDFRTELLK